MVGISSVLVATAIIATMPLSPTNAASVCPGPVASVGAIVRGPVLQVPDGSTICVALNPAPTTWMQIALSAGDTTRSALMTAAFAKTATCFILSDGTGRCLIDGKPLADALRSVELARTTTHWR
jgi:hypothetical protein